MYITSWAFVSVFEMNFINTRYIKSYITSWCFEGEMGAIWFWNICSTCDKPYRVTVIMQKVITIKINTFAFIITFFVMGLSLLTASCIFNSLVILISLMKLRVPLVISNFLSHALSRPSLWYPKVPKTIPRMTKSCAKATLDFLFIRY